MIAYRILGLSTLQSRECTYKGVKVRIVIQDMQIFVKTPNKTIVIECDCDDTIQTVKRKIRDKEGFPLDLQRIVFIEKQLDNDKTLADYNVQNESTIYLFIRLRGWDKW